MTRAQLQAAIDAEEQRQGLLPDSLIAESTLEEAAKRLGLSPDELRERALKATQPKSSSYVKRPRPLPPLWTIPNRKLFTAGLVVALFITGIEGISRLQALPQVKLPSFTLPNTRSGVSSPTQFSPLDQHFKSLLAQTVGPNATLRMVAKDGTRWLAAGQKQGEMFSLEGVPDGYEVFFPGAERYHFQSNMSNYLGVSFQPIGQSLESFDSTRQTEAISSWHYVRYGNTWYIRAWVNAADLVGLSKNPFNQVKASPISNPAMTEIVVPAGSAEIRRPYLGSNASSGTITEYYVTLPANFKSDQGLVTATKRLGAFRTEVPVIQPTGPTSMEAMDFRTAGFTASSNLVDVNEIHEGTPFVVPDNALGLLGNGRTVSQGYGQKRQSVRSICVQKLLVSGNWCAMGKPSI
ncbi:MAG: hypothetical protein QM758_25350 [Armatimonas sp.]